jgi:LacI family transcriptional regulator
MARVTLREVAGRARVSVTTASQVLNDVPGTRIKSSTRDRVRATARELGYAPNRLAQGLRLQRSNTLGLISDQIATSPHAGKTILGAQDAAAEHGSLLMLMNSENDSELEERQIQALIQRQVDGIVYAAEHHVVLTPPDVLRAVPNVLLDARATTEGFSWVVPDEIQGVDTAVAELLRHGHRRIGFVQCSIDLAATGLRRKGFEQALRSAGCTFDPALVVADTTDGPGGFRAARALLELPAETRPTALFCFNDRMAMGSYQAAAELGLRVGHDVSIVGFDDQEIIAANLRPGLTTVALPHYEMGRWAVDTLIRSIDSGREEPRTELMACPLVRRASVGTPPRR